MYKNEDLPQTIGDAYTLTRVLGKGGMAVVYAADVDLSQFDYALVISHHEEQRGETRTQRDQRRVKRHERWARKPRAELESICQQFQLPYPVTGRAAVKLMMPHLEQDERFRAEWQSLLAIAHPNLVQVYGGGHDEQKDLHYYAMELLEGILRNKEVKQLPLVDKLLIVRQAAEGLKCLHDKGIIHRDIKPGNIVCVRRFDGQIQAKVADLGIAKDTNRTQELTVTDTVMGTPYYMAPEQAEGARRVTELSDVYSLGATLYYYVCGKAPYDNQSLYEVLGHLAQSKPPIPPRQMAGGKMPDALDLLISKMMAMDPGKRPPGMGQVVAAIDRYLERGGEEEMGDARTIMELPKKAVRVTKQDKREIQELLGGPAPSGGGSSKLAVALLVLLAFAGGFLAGPGRKYVEPLLAQLRGESGETAGDAGDAGASGDAFGVIVNGGDASASSATGDSGKTSGGETGGDSGKTTGGASGGESGSDSGKTTGSASGGETGGDSGKTTGGASGGESGSDSGKTTGSESGGETGGDSGKTTGGESGGDSGKTTGGESGGDAGDAGDAGDSGSSMAAAFAGKLANARGEVEAKVAADDFAGARATLEGLREAAKAAGTEAVEQLDAGLAALDQRLQARLGALAGQVTAAVEAGKLDDARAALDAFRKLAPEDPRGAGLANAIGDAEASMSAAAARKAELQQQLTALGEQAKGLDADALAKASAQHASLEARAKAAGLDEAWAAAGAQLTARGDALVGELADQVDSAIANDLEQAGALVDRIAELRPDHPKVAGWREAIAARRAEAASSAKLLGPARVEATALLERGLGGAARARLMFARPALKQAGAEGQLDAALKQLDAAIEVKAAPLAAAVTEHAKAGKPISAIEALERLERLAPSRDGLPALRDALGKTLLGQEKAVVADLRRLANEEDKYAEALRALALMTESARAAGDAAVADRLAAQAKRMIDLREFRVEDFVAEVEDALEAKNKAGALEKLETFASICPGHARLRELQDKVDGKQARELGVTVAGYARATVHGREGAKEAAGNLALDATSAPAAVEVQFPGLPKGDYALTVEGVPGDVGAVETRMLGWTGWTWVGPERGAVELRRFRHTGGDALLVLRLAQGTGLRLRALKLVQLGK